MSGKLLHELLRDWANARPFSFNEAWRTLGVAGNDNMLAAFADEIERQYVPVPRFPDGEPVREGSETRYGTVERIDVEVSDTCWGSWVVHFDDGECIEGTFSQRVERPAPKVLDADGVEIKVGDTLYHGALGTEYNVVELDPEDTGHALLKLKSSNVTGWYALAAFIHERPVFDADGERICKGDTVLDTKGYKGTVRDIKPDIPQVIVERGPNDHAYLTPDVLTHREPDSLEKAMDRFQSILEDHDGLEPETEDELWDVHRRLTALMERGA